MEWHILYSYQREPTMAQLNTQTRYIRQVAQDRKAAALQRAEERRLEGQTTEERINALYTKTQWTL